MKTTEDSTSQERPRITAPAAAQAYHEHLNGSIAQHLVASVGTIEVPVRRGKPSMPPLTVGSEELPHPSDDAGWRNLALKRAADAKERLERQARAVPVKPPKQQTIVAENASVGAGKSAEDRLRVLTLSDRMHDDDRISVDEQHAANALRELLHHEMGWSQGVSSYGDLRGEGCPLAELGDRRAVAILKQSRSNLRKLADAVFAACGVVDTSGVKMFDDALAVILIRSCCEASNRLSLTEIGTKTTPGYQNGKSSAAGGAVLKHLYSRLALHFKFSKGVEFTDWGMRRMALDFKPV